MKLILKIIVVTLFLSSCATQQANTPDPQIDLNLFPPHIEINCRLYNSEGLQLRKYPGRFCIYEPNGDLILASRDSVVRFNGRMEKIWEKKFNHIHHQFRKSEATGNILFLDSEITGSKSKPQRHDVLQLINDRGEVLKSIRVRDLFKQIEKKGYKLKSSSYADWVRRDMKSDTPHIENSHVNSFYEMYSVDNLKQVTGYVINCYHQNLIVLLDTNFNVTSVINAENRFLHDVQWNKTELFFYQNHTSAGVDSDLSEIGIYNFKTNAFEPLYSAKSPSRSARACSSVQLIDRSRLFIFHSACTPTEKTISANVLEFVDLKSKATRVLTMDAGVSANTAYMLDARDFLKNSIGL